MSPYTIYILPQALREVRELPGHFRHRIKQAIEKLANDPRPTNSKALESVNLAYEVRRLRIDRWRVIYAISETEKVIDILGVRRRPPYDYGDLGEILERLG